jgi:hypothetical protein
MKEYLKVVKDDLTPLKDYFKEQFIGEYIAGHISLIPAFLLSDTMQEESIDWLYKSVMTDAILCGSAGALYGYNLAGLEGAVFLGAAGSTLGGLLPVATGIVIPPALMVLSPLYDLGKESLDYLTSIPKRAKEL